MLVPFEVRYEVLEEVTQYVIRIYGDRKSVQYQQAVSRLREQYPVGSWFSHASDTTSYSLPQLDAGFVEVSYNALDYVKDFCYSVGKQVKNFLWWNFVATDWDKRSKSNG